MKPVGIIRSKFDNKPLDVPRKGMSTDNDTIQTAKLLADKLLSMRHDVLETAKNKGVSLGPLLGYIYTVAAFDIESAKNEPVDLSALVATDNDDKAIDGITPFHLAGIFAQKAGHTFRDVDETQKFVRRVNRVLAENSLYVSTGSAPGVIGRLGITRNHPSVKIRLVSKDPDNENQWRKIPLGGEARGIPSGLHIVSKHSTYQPT